MRRLVNEPTAAALAYGLQDRDGESTFLVVDLGGGTFDVSILEMFSGVMEVRSSAGDAFLGGEDFTDRILAHFRTRFDDAKLSNEDTARLRAAAERAKRSVGDNPASEQTFVLGEAEHALTLTRSTFEEITKDLVSRMRMPLQRAINDAGLKAAQIDRIVLVGGATRMPLVRNLITRLFKRFPEHELDPDTVVALGTAVQAGLIARDAGLEELVMTDVCPFTLGHEVSRDLPGHKKEREQGVFSPLIERNTTVPVSRSEIVSPVSLGQTQITISVYQGEAPYVRDNIPIGEYTVPIPVNNTKHEKLDVRFTYDTSGVLEVVSTVISTGKQSTLIIESNPGALTAAEIEQRFKDLAGIKIHPREQAVNEALLARLAAAYANALGARRAMVADMMNQFEGALASYDKRLIADIIQAIEDQLPALEGHDVLD